MSNLHQRLLLCFAALLLTCGPAVTAAKAAERAPRKLPVRIVCTCDDDMGKAYVAAFTEALSKDGRYVVKTVDSDDALRINIISMPIITATGQPGAAFSIVCVHNMSMMHQFVTTCAHLPIAECAKSMVTSLTDLED